MRDRNQLTLDNFIIQLSKRILNEKFRNFLSKQEEYFSHQSRLWRSDTKIPNSEIRVVIPKDYRLTRSLSIALWFFPENLRYLYLLELESRKFTHFNSKQQLEISILLSSKENCVKYLFLTKRYTGSEIFGNLLGNDLMDLCKVLKIQKKNQQRAQKKVFRRGPKDYGSRRSDSTISIIVTEIQKDVFVQLEEERIRGRKLLLQQTLHRILLVLEDSLTDV